LPPVAFVRSRGSPNFLQLVDSEICTYAGSMAMDACIGRVNVVQRNGRQRSTLARGMEMVGRGMEMVGRGERRGLREPSGI
jgi:hypothetical protein